MDPFPKVSTQPAPLDAVPRRGPTPEQMAARSRYTGRVRHATTTAATDTDLDKLMGSQSPRQKRQAAKRVEEREAYLHGPQVPLIDYIPWWGWVLFVVALFIVAGYFDTKDAVKAVALLPIRASSLAELFDCPARWYAKQVKGMQLPSSGAAQLGTALHASTAVFDSSRLPGGSPVSASDAAAALVDAIWKPEREVDWDEDSPAVAERIGLALHSRYCAEIAPTQHYIAVEVTCAKLELPELGIVLTGTADRVKRVRKAGGGHGISDVKSGVRAVGTDGKAVTQKHAIQTGVYELLAEHAMGIPIEEPAEIIGLQTGKTAASQRIGLGLIERPRDALVGTEESPGLLEHAATIVKHGAFYGNPSSMLCTPKFCPAYETCRFRT